MHRDKRELIVRLCTEAGMVMEHAVSVSLTVGGLDDADLVTVLDDLERQSAKIVQLITAAKAAMPKR